MNSPKRLSWMLLMLLLASVPAAHSQYMPRIGRVSCMPNSERTAAAHRAPFKGKRHATPAEWNPAKTYRQLVVLVEFSDQKFKKEHNRDFYDQLFNNFSTKLYEGKKRYGTGSVADYFRDQSHGKLSLRFDILGPYQIEALVRPTEYWDYKLDEIREATQMMVNDQAGRDFSPYDWDGDGSIDQIVYIFAGPCGFMGDAGYILPSTDTSCDIKTLDGMPIAQTSASSELWTPSIPVNAGIGTICHEFSHCLGLPDLYPTNGNTYVIDDWALMDGGNFINYGWCPPNYTPLEKMQLGWLTPVELTASASIRDLKPVADGGEAYLIRHTDTEYYLLENRQQKGWDAGLPGKGLVVWHVNYNENLWNNNQVNNYPSMLGIQLVHADNLNYSKWVTYVNREGWEVYANEELMNSRYLSTSPYPYVKQSYTNNELSDTSSPKAEMYQLNEAGSRLLGKTIANIQMTADGLISFDFICDDAPSGISSLQPDDADVQACWYDLQGRRLSGKPTRKGTYLYRGKKFIVR